MKDKIIEITNQWEELDGLDDHKREQFAQEIEDALFIENACMFCRRKRIETGGITRNDFAKYYVAQIAKRKMKEYAEYMETKYRPELMIKPSNLFYEFMTGFLDYLDQQEDK